MAKPTKNQIWSNIDVFALLNGISIWDEQYKNLKYIKRPFDEPLYIKNKILNQHDNPHNTNKQGLINALSNEFDIKPYNVISKNNFELSYQPQPSGSLNTQDIFVYFRPSGELNWYPLFPQLWSENINENTNYGFVVWQNDKYSNINNIKNFTYSNALHILESLDDNTEIKVVYYVIVKDEDNKNILVKYTDMNDPLNPYDKRFTYRSPNKYPDLTNNVICYTLNDIPLNIYSGFYFDGDKPKEFIYNIRDIVESKFKHKWIDVSDSTTIWDVNYGSGHISQLYDADAPKTFLQSPFAAKSLYFNSIYTGGVEEFSDSLYLKDIIEFSENNKIYWKPHIYPGKFYLNGVPYYLFENPQIEYITFNNNTAPIPSGLARTHYTILAESGYYNTYYNSPDYIISGLIFEDYSYPTGEDGNYLYTSIYRRVPNLITTMGINTKLDFSEYKIDFDNNIIHALNISNAMLIWDKVDQPSGVILNYDLNPINDSNITLDKYFLYLTTKDIG